MIDPSDFADTEPDPGWVTWLLEAEEEFHARAVLIPGAEGQPQAYLFPLPKEH